jgi:uncharacterized membrane protein
MDSSIFLARLIGPLFVVIGAGLLVNRENYRTLAREFLESPALIYIAGIIAFLGGLAIVLTHNVWIAGWPVIITILGWITLIGGVIRIVIPSASAQLGERMLRNEYWLPIAAAIYVALGLWLSIAGFFW